MITYHARHANKLLALGATLAALNTMVALSTGQVLGFGSTLLCLIVGLMQKSIPLITIDPDRIELRKGLLRAKRIHSLRGLTAVGPLTETFIVVTTVRESFEIPVAGLSDDDRTNLFYFLRDVVPKHGQAREVGPTLRPNMTLPIRPSTVVPIESSIQPRHAAPRWATALDAAMGGPSGLALSGSAPGREPLRDKGTISG